MKQYIKISNRSIRSHVVLLCGLLLLQVRVSAQDNASAEQEKPVAVKPKPVKNTFESVWIIDNQTVMVPVKGTLEMDIMHRFGTVEKGYSDFWGLFASSNIRLGLNYAPIKNLSAGIGVIRNAAAVSAGRSPSTVTGPIWDGSIKYSLLRQTKGGFPVSVSYYGNAAYNTKRDTEQVNFRNYSDRLSFFHQLIIARKISNSLSIQVAPSISHQNLVDGYFKKLNDSTLEVNQKMKFNHIAIAFSGRYKMSNGTALMVSYDQPLTKHVRDNPNPNLSLGVEFNTSGHSFQLFFTNYLYLSPQINNLYNHNAPFDYTDAENKKISGGKFLLGFNITRLWNY
jgi:hypothetical protein